MIKKLALLLGGAALAASLAACGSKDDRPGSGTSGGQTSGKYQGKPDTRPWENETTKFSAVKVEKGNKEAWERQIRERNQNQNEYVRTN
jgi:major membrane immunogen (membrane-anchored lipoprotein)